MFRTLLKVSRFIRIYGPFRTYVKIIGRLRKKHTSIIFFLKRKQEIGLIGCGQFQFSTIAFFLSKGLVNKFLFCYDINQEKAATLAAFYKIPFTYTSEKELLNSAKKPKIVYIASNHNSHFDYSIKFLNLGVSVYCEKPIAVNFSQFINLKTTIEKSSADFYVGYNRPHSPAICITKSNIRKNCSLENPFSIACFVTAHDISPNHWYRNKEEGTRICGNAGHWIDLMIHLFNIRSNIPKVYTVQIAFSNDKEPDDNISISITTELGDLFNLFLTARTEPFEGINETININFDKIICKIDDFRKLTLWNEEKIINKKFWPKDVGHQASIMQPFSKSKRDINEILISTELMLHIKNMVVNTEHHRIINI